MIGRFPNKQLFKYPRMSLEDSKIWGRYLSKFSDLYDSFDYDLRVGAGVTPDLPIPEKFIKDYEDLTKKRIDAVGYKNNKATLFEVKPRAGTAALGQLISYRDLFLRSHPYIQISSLVCVTELIQPEELEIYIQHNIHVEVV